MSELDCLELVMLKHGLRITREGGEQFYDFSRFNLEGFRKTCEADLKQIKKVMLGGDYEKASSN